MYTTDKTCLRERKGKTYLTRISCDNGSSECCFIDRIFTLTPEKVPNDTLTCKIEWLKCLNSSAAVNNKSKLSDAEKIWINVFSFLIAMVLLGVTYLLYRLFQQRKKQQHRRVSDVSVMTTMNPCHDETDSQTCQSIDDEVDKIVRDTGQIDCHDVRRLLELKQSRNKKQLSLFLKAIETTQETNLHRKDIDDARGILEAWETDEELQRFCNKADKHLHTWELTNFQKIIQKAEMSLYKEQILSIKNAKLLLLSELSRQNVINDLKVQITREMQNNNFVKLQLLLEEVRAKHLESEFDKELTYVKNQSRKNFSGSADIERHLKHAIERRDPVNLNQLIQQAERSKYRTEINEHLVKAKKTMTELQEIEKLIDAHKETIKDSIRSGDKTKIEQTLLSIRLDGFGETLTTEINDLQMALRDIKLIERLKANLSKAVQSSDIFKIKQVIADLRNSRFFDKLGPQLEEAQKHLLELQESLEWNLKRINK